MEKVLFTYKNGRERSMRPREAEILSRLGKGSYLTRDMRAAEPAPVQAAEPVVSPVPVAPVSDLESMDADALRAMAVEPGLKIHHKAGAKKIREAIEAHKASE